MSLKFFGNKRLQRRHLLSSASVCRWPFQASLLCVLRLIKSSSRSTPPGSSPNLALPGERISPSNRLALPVVRGSPRLWRRRQASSPSPDPETTRMSNDCPSTRVISTVYSRSATIRRVPRASRLQSLRSLPLPLPTLFPRPTSGHLSLQDVRSRRSSLCVVPKTRIQLFSGGRLQDLSCPPSFDWLVLDS